MKAQVTDSLRQHFRPEFLNRVDEVIVFHALTDADLTAIVGLLLDRPPTAAGHPGPQSRADGRGARAHRPRGPRPDVRGAAAQADDPAPRREPVREGPHRGPIPTGRPDRRGRGPGRLDARVLVRRRDGRRRCRRAARCQKHGRRGRRWRWRARGPRAEGGGRPCSTCPEATPRKRDGEELVN